MFLSRPFLDYIPQRIISLVPSQTELLYSLGLEKETVAITKFCVHPSAWFQSKKRIGGTKQLHIEEIKSLQPDLIIANKEENVKEQIEELAISFPVWLTDVNNYTDALNMISDVGKLTGKTEGAERVINDIKTAFNTIPAYNKIPAAYLIWKDPFMATGGGTFINDMLGICGFENVFADLQRYPEVTAEDIRKSGARVLLLSSEPYPYAKEHMISMQSIFPGIKIICVDGEMFSWYGSRMEQAASYFNELVFK